MNAGIGWPLASNRIRRGAVSNTYGPVRRTAAGTVRVHQGWDFEARIGTPCMAIADGHVATVYSSADYGQVIVLAFPFEGRPHYAAYAHLSAVEVAPGALVKKGQRIGLTGESGNARGMAPIEQHLHFEIRTEARPGRGLSGRISPLHVFGELPLKQAVTA